MSYLSAEADSFISWCKFVSTSRKFALVASSLKLASKTSDKASFFAPYTPEIRKGSKELSVGAGVYLNFCRGSIHATCVQMLTVANDVRYRISGAMQSHGIGSQGISQAYATRLISRTTKLQLR